MDEITYNMNPLVSIITLTYNHEKYIGQCVESVLNQTFTDWEMIIINDGSTDNTEEIILQYTDPRIKYYKQDNIGPSKLDVTYNRALGLCKGKLIAILEGDDFWPQSKLEYQIPAFNDHDVILSHGYFKLIYEGTSKSREGIRRNNDKIINNNPVGYMLFDFVDGLMPRAVTVMIRKDILLKIGGVKLSGNVTAIDYGTFMELSLMGKFKFIDSVLGFWRRHVNSISFNDSLINSANIFILKFIEKHQKEILNLGLPFEMLRSRLLNRTSFWKYFGSYIVHENELIDIGIKSNTKKYLKMIAAKGLEEKNYILLFASLVGFISIFINLNLLETSIQIYWKLSGFYTKYILKNNYR